VAFLKVGSMNSARFGFHLSIKGGILNAAKVAEYKKYRTFQLFVSNPRSWQVTHAINDNASQFHSINTSSDILPFAHMPYLCNIASPRQEIIERSIGSAIANIDECNRLGIDYLVFHMGSHLGKGSEAGQQRIVKTLSSIIESTKRCNILLENSAGYKNSMGSKISDIASVINILDSKRIGVCLDTCHLYAAGYDLRSSNAVESLCEEFDSSIGIDKLKLVHLNDSKYKLGSGLDRHWHIGKGYIGRAGFINIFKSRLFRSGPFVMETPYNSEGTESYNFEAATSLYKEALS